MNTLFLALFLLAPALHAAAPPSSSGSNPGEAPYVDAEESQIEEQDSREKIRRPFRDKLQSGRIQKRYIEHPYADKGLYKITTDGTYLYRVGGSPQVGTASIKFGLFEAPNFVNSQLGTTFSEIYGSGNFLLMMDYEWPLKKIPNLGLKLASGLLSASGNGRFESDANAGLESLETFTFVMLPNSASLIFKFKFWPGQWLVPYAEGGVGYWVFNETRSDGQPPLGRWGGAANAHAAGGVAISLTSWARDAALRIDAEYGINNIWLTAEARQIIGFGTFDMTSTLFNGGLSFDF